MTQPIRTIVLGIAAQEEHNPVLASLIRVANVLGATLHAVHVYGLPDPIQNAYVRQMLLGPGVIERYGEELRARLQAQVRGYPGGDAVVCHTIAGSVSERLCELATQLEADLLVVGATRRNRLWRNFLGTAAEGVIRQSAVPVLVLRQPVDRPFERVLLTTDLSPFSAAVQVQSLELMRALTRSNPDVRSLLVVQFDVLMPLPLRQDLLQDVARRELDSFLRRQAPGQRVEGRVRIGDPPEEILTEAAEWMPDLLILGAHGRPGSHQFLLGSVAGSTLRSAECNVLVIPRVERPTEETAMRAAAEKPMSEAAKDR